MKIAIDTSTLEVTSAGTTTYIKELLLAIKNCNSGNEIIELTYKNHFSRKNIFLRKYDTINREIIWLNMKLPNLASQLNADVLHSPAMALPLKAAIPTVATVHDIYILKNPLHFNWWLRTYMNYMLPKMIQNSTRIIAVSNFTKQEILEVFPSVDQDKIFVTWEGVDAFYSRLPRENHLDFIRRFNIKRPFLLTVSTIEPRKNLLNILKAFALEKEKIDHELLLIGVWGWKSKKLLDIICELKLNDRVRFLGYVTKDDLRSAYNLADAFLYPSLYEGFGLPILEAMACGCPVITSNMSSMPEVAGDAAIMVDPLKFEEIAVSLRVILDDSQKKEQLRQKGLNRVSLFSWERCARETLKVYADAINVN